MLLLTLDPSSPVPAFRQICERIVALADEGTLRAGARLPASRTLASRLGLHRSTVVRAYDEARALGYLESRAGSYTTVRARARLPATRSAAPRGPALLDWGAISAPGARAAYARSTAGPEPSALPAIDLERLAPDPTLAPGDELGRCLRGALAGARGATLDYTASARAPLF